ncbi:MAG: hypothetical protein EAZ57_08920 [Cytophagales bacterium]|nr:MAG: hypothetical protein EAZ67_09730 [Cytophagales bacterium]TAF60021.1 MAG: hypothetical protein EAZ57_08920 [Cytophagales bacterium]
MKFKYLFCILLITKTSLLSANVDIKHIKLDLKFDWSKSIAHATAEITLSPQSESKQIDLDAGNLRIESVALNNRELEFKYDGGDADKNLHIILDRKYLSKETLKLLITYSTQHVNHSDPNAIGGSLGKGLRFMQPTSTTPTKRQQIWSSGEPNGNKYWFPCNEELSDIHTTEIIGTVDKPLTILSNGSLISIKENDNGSRTFHYKSSSPFPSYLASIVVGEYQAIVQKTKNTDIYTYGYPDEKESVGASVELLPEMMRFIENKTGYAFPYPIYNQVVVQDYPYPGLVGQHNAVILSDNYIDDYGVHKDFKYLWDGVAVQGLASQWFGNLLMPKSWNDIWLNNAFAEYFAGLFTIQSNDIAEYLLWYYYPWEKSIVSNDWQSNVKYPVVPTDFKNIPLYNSNNANKFRGALIMRMLQQELGEDKWWKAIKHYVKTNAGKHVTTRDFQNAIEKVSGQSYEWFFDQWIYKIGMPDLQVIRNYDPTKKALQLTIKQNQSPNNNTPYKQVNYFRGKIAIEIDGSLEYIELKPQAETITVFHRDTEPGYVHFNVHENFLCHYSFEKSDNEYKTQLKKSKDVAAQKLAIDYLAAVASDSTTASAEKNHIETLLIDEINSNKYWRYRLYALNTLQAMQTKPYKASFKDLLIKIIHQEQSWIKSSAIFMLGNTTDPQYFDLYKSALTDTSDRVINAAAIAIGKTKDSRAYNLLINKENQPSWKNQNRISALNGLQQLGDARAVDYALQCIKDNLSPRWYLATPTWDYPFAAVNTLVSLGKGDLAYPILKDRLTKSLLDNDINDIFQNLQLIDLLSDKRATEIYQMLKEHFKYNAVILEAINNYEKNYLEGLK